MYFYDALKLVVDGKFRKLRHGSYFYEIGPFDFLQEVEGEEFSVSNVSWFLDDKWEAIDEVLPLGVVRGEDGCLYKKEVYERWQIVTWNGHDFGTYVYFSKETF